MADAGGPDGGAVAERISVKELWLYLGAFVVFTTALATQHAMWRDEVRAFSVATHSGSWLDLLDNIHQDGHPIVWYAILRIGFALTHSMLVLPVASLVIAWGAAYLILRHAPFPLWARLMAIFGAFLGHEYSVVCRNYGIGVLLMLMACVLYPTRRERPVRLGIVLALLANTSVHASIAALMLGFVWLTDVFEPSSRRAVLRPISIAALGLGVSGVAFALWTARVPPDMSYAFSFNQLRPGEVLRVLAMDPGAGLMGYQRANMAAAGELPWARVGIDPMLASRLVVDASLVGIAWSLRRIRACLIAALLAVAGFEVLFRLIYTGSLRHEGIIAFLMISLVWIACVESGARQLPVSGRSIVLGLLPLLLFQTAALPVIVRRELSHPASSSKALAAAIHSTPRFQDAILAGEPDYIMEAMPYYVRNRIFMPREQGFDYRAYFDRGARRVRELRLGGLIDIVDRLSCATGQRVLLSIGYPRLLSDSAGEAQAGYGSVFQWDSAERSRLFARGSLIASFTGATTDENYNVFEIPAVIAPACHPPRP